MSMISEESKVRQANKDFYNIVGDSYEIIDGRRSASLSKYVNNILSQIVLKVGPGSILDLGSGSGFVIKLAKEYFNHRYAIDISGVILSKIKEEKILKIIAEFDHFPLKNNQFNCVVTFAVLHHCFSYEKIFDNIYNALKPGGVYYSDHDLDSLFFKRFSFFINLYRRVNNVNKRYLSKFCSITQEMYNYSEFHSHGIKTEYIKRALELTGFKSVECKYHWFGINPFLNVLFGKRSFPKGWAPLIRIIAYK